MTADDSWWQLMTADDSWWQLMTVDDSWWQTMRWRASSIEIPDSFYWLNDRSSYENTEKQTGMKKERLCTVPTVTPEGPLGSQSSESIVEFVDLHRVAVPLLHPQEVSLEIGLAHKHKLCVKAKSRTRTRSLSSKWDRRSLETDEQRKKENPSASLLLEVQQHKLQHDFPLNTATGREQQQAAAVSRQS